MKRITLTAIAVVLIAFHLGAQAVAGTWGVLDNTARYSLADRNTIGAPIRVAIRCQGWAEDSLATLELKVFERDTTGQVRVVYRCVVP